MKLLVDEERKFYKKVILDEDLLFKKISEKLIYIYGEEPVIFEKVLRQRILNYYLLQYQVDSEEEFKTSENKPNRIGVLSGDFVEKVFYYLIFELLKDSGLKVGRDCIFSDIG